jgi:hypothetical protein
MVLVSWNGRGLYRGSETNFVCCTNSFLIEKEEGMIEILSSFF